MLMLAMFGAIPAKQDCIGTEEKAKLFCYVVMKLNYKIYTNTKD